MRNIFIGNGLISNAMQAFDSDFNNVCIFASGVSNSLCISSDEFLRERLLLLNAIKNFPNLKFIYFSTCSIYSGEDTPYINHKLMMEKIISSCNNFTIIRLPQVVGFTMNPHTLINVLFHSINSSKLFVVHKFATRNIIDVSDLAVLTSSIINDHKLQNLIVNVANSKSTTIIELINIIEEYLKKSGVFHYLDRGSSYNIEVSDCLRHANSLGIRFDDDYVKNVIYKYYQP